MVIDECTLPKSNKLVTDYLLGEKKAQAYFEYDYKDLQTYINRKHELSDRHFPREALVEHLLQFNELFSTHPKVFENIKKLREKDSTVVITGQQAGFLTGPLYTIYKAISTIVHAKQLEKKLQSPIVPVFWVAGEDHDYEEINHIWLLKDHQLVKEKYSGPNNSKRPVTNIEINHREMKAWIENVFALFGETEHSEAVLQFIAEKLEGSNNVTEFFIRIMAAFFEKYGLVFVDSANENIRKIESPFFKELIQQNEKLRHAFQEQRNNIVKDGYPAGVESEPRCAHLFYHVNDERQLLYHVNDDVYTLKDIDVKLTKEELEIICEQHPEQLSNNVVTRPLMQEFLFPTLAFVAGPGEITYWAQLKPLFTLFNKKMPPIVPRMHVTIVERNVNKWMQNLQLPLQTILSSGVSKYRNEWFEKQKGDHAESIVQETKHLIDLAHANLRKFAWSLDHNLGQISEKNRLLIMEQLDYMERRIEQMYEHRHSYELALFKKIEATLVPNGGLQERMWNVFYYINRYGIEFIDQLIIEHQINESKHYILFL